MPIEETAHRNMYGDTGTNFDRPIEMEDQLSLAADNAALRQQLDAVAAAYNRDAATPQREAALHQQREAVKQHLADRYGLYDLSVPGEEWKLDAFVANETEKLQHTQALEHGRIEASMSNAHAQYGADFEDAYRDLTTMDVNNPLARSIVQSVVNSADPGQQLMQWHNSHIVQGLGPSVPPPFLPYSMRPPYTQRPARPSNSMDAGFGDWETENAIFNSAFDDRGY